ncbi:carboxymuconolactone decarboxylase family protein [Arthrobacter sp. Br18]|uniref:carboxymuconolactone decarboxylase family protein n=1 Tax=Arthrobacter sp. Br18 TaxID=1312954 RepID=UPI0004AC7D16|nr:carboxymuconolactone decarboxylase family protein [Arthrobacter sp. Br18]
MDRLFFLDKSDPGSWKALNGLALKVAAAAEAAGLNRALVELVNVRISQLNGCAYCLDLHDRLAREAGASDQHLAVLTAWRETALFDETERAALAIGEAVTALHHDATALAELAGARAVLTEAQYSALQWCAITIDAFNRVSILSAHPVRPRTTSGDPVRPRTTAGPLDNQGAAATPASTGAPP